MPRHFTCRRAALVAGLLLLGVSAPAAAGLKTPTCVEVVSAREDAEAFAQLVRAELDRHDAYLAVPANTGARCRGYLLVERIDVAEGSFLTGRLNGQVPHREKLRQADDSEALTEALTELLRVVLHNDPQRLRGPGDEGVLSRSLRALRRHGRNLYGLELMQVVAHVGGGRFETAPGAAFRYRREVGHWQLGARFAFAVDPALPQRTQLDLLGFVAVHAEIAWFASRLAETSFYGSALLGLELLHLHGRATKLGGEARDEVTVVLPEVGFRVGVEMFRSSSARFDLFGQISVPVIPARDPEAGVVDAWTPTAQLGVGVGF